MSIISPNCQNMLATTAFYCLFWKTCGLFGIHVAPRALVCRGAFDLWWHLLCITIWLLKIFLKTLVSHFLSKRFYSLFVLVRVVLKMTVVQLIEVTDALTAWLEIIIKARQGITCQSSIKSGQLFFLHTSFLNNLLAIKGKEKYVFSAEARCDRVTSSEDHGVLDTRGNLLVSFSFSYMRK